MSRLNDDAKSSVNTTSLSNAARPLNSSNPWVPKNKLRLCLFALGRAET